MVIREDCDNITRQPDMRHVNIDDIICPVSTIVV